MLRLSYQKKDYQTYWWVKLLLLILTMLLISFDASFAQDRNKKERKIRINGKTVTHKERDPDKSRSNACNRLTNRTIDGTCNNIETNQTANWGAADIKLYREMYPAYGAPDFYNDMSGNARLSAREISNLVAAQSNDILSPRNLSSLVFTWGQFIDHDIDLTPEGETEYVPILLPANEPLFTSPIPFLRSEVYPGTGVTSPREQQNIITAWLDGSQVYGSEESRADWLRTHSQGKLKVSSGNLLPYNTTTGELGSPIDPNAPSMAGDNGGTEKVFVAGDVRANEQPGLTALHTLFVREHNRICDQLAQQGMNNDEQMYQRAKRRVSGYMQAITYNQFLPALGITISSYNGYKKMVQPDISNIFATAAYRLGHTMVTNEIPLIDVDCQPTGDGSVGLVEGFFNPQVIETFGIEPLLQGLASQTQQKVDLKIVDNLRNFLFGDPNSGSIFGLDLASLNIQRGRDHGLPDYNSVRAHYTNLPASNFGNITNNQAVKNALEAAYGNVYDMDLWVGLLAEDPLPGSSVGITLNAILGDQFEKLRDGDFYFYRNDPALSPQMRDQIHITTLRSIIVRNTPVESLQNNVFFAKSCHSGGGGGGNGGGHGNGGNGGGGHGGGGHGNGGGHGGGGGNNGGGGFDDGANNRNLLDNGETIAGGMLSVYPNPAVDKINVSVLLEVRSNAATINVQNLDGKTYFHKTANIYGNSFYHQLDLSHVPSGVYLVTVQTDTEFFSERLVVN